MTKDERSDRAGAAPGVTGIDRLFGRDLRRGGWFVDCGGDEGTRNVRPRRAETEGRTERKPDPAVIWALRRRRK
jgi:hypothetical protein